jgi:hypothetical protein
MEDSITEQELFEKAKRMLSNGHRFSYIYQQLSAKTNDSEMIARVIDRVKEDQQMIAARAEQQKKYSEGSSKFVPVGMGLLLIALGVIIHFFIFSEGFIGTLPFVLMAAGAIIAIRGLVK